MIEDDNEPDYDAPVVFGGRETWAELADRVQRMFGKGSRVFLIKQMGVDVNAPAQMLILSPGPFLTELLEQAAEQLRAEKSVPIDPTDPPPGTRLD